MTVNSVIALFALYTEFRSFRGPLRTDLLRNYYGLPHS